MKDKSHNNFNINPITIDEGIPGYRQEALEIVESFCSKLNLKHNVYSYKDLYDLTLEEALKEEKGDDNAHNNSNRTMSSCSICGTLRRRAIDHAAKDIEADVIATGHNLDDTLQTFVINMLSGDTKKVGWMDPDNVGDTTATRKIKPFCEIYESEIVFFAFTNNLPFQAEPCPHMNEGIRTEIREFLNQLENNHTGIKNNLYQSIRKVSQIVNESSNSHTRITCARCGSPCTGNTCSVCKMIIGLKR